MSICDYAIPPSATYIGNTNRRHVFGHFDNRSRRGRVERRLLVQDRNANDCADNHT
jgi:hypothetical protein